MQLLCMIVMARFLSPADFGAYAIVMMFINFALIFGSAGVSQILIMKRDDSAQLATSLFYLNLVFGALAYLLLLLISPLIAELFDNAELVPLLNIAGLVFLVQAPLLVQRSIMERDLKFEALVKAETVTILIATCLGIGCAFMGFGVYSLLVFNLSAIGLLTAAIWLICDWRPVGMASLPVLRETMGLVLHFTGFTLLNFLTRHCDVFLIGKLMSSSALGLYSMAYRLTIYPVQAFSQIVHRVAYPTLSSLRDDPASARAFYLRSLQGITLLVFPALVGMACIAELIVPMVLGSQWIDMVVVVQILVWVGLLQVVTATVGTILPAMEKTRLMLNIGAVNTLVIVLAFALAVPYGVSGMATAYLLANLVMFFIQARVAWPLLGLSVGEGLKATSPALIGSLLMGGLVIGAGAAYRALDLHEIGGLALQILVGAVSYPLLVWLFFKESSVALLAELRHGVGASD
ncbi:Membrane protein involved in the export of O-antigen and teichoic acid [Congregibacter litoralis KT71]|uniref:Membrane protein involved in the export of O-antigen and teichoic acid n=2 Tax=Congregibacter TaxID=393661 RepID=A4A6G8_9GAMM|nr:Membrane protein involved in the export of O-antigen and teichoic acid [Congregibacter litoralis KT71]